LPGQAFFYDVDAAGSTTKGSDYYQSLAYGVIDGTRKIFQHPPWTVDPGSLRIAKYVVAVTRTTPGRLYRDLRLVPRGIIAFGDRAHALARTMVHIAERVPFVRVPSRAQRRSSLCSRFEICARAFAPDDAIEVFRFVDTRFLYHLWL